MPVMCITIAIRSNSQLNTRQKVLGRRGKYINDPHILKEVVIVDTFLHGNFPYIRFKHE